MFKDIRRLYLYAVSFVALMMILFSTIRLSGVIAEALVPAPPPMPAPVAPAPGELDKDAKVRWQMERAQQDAYERRRLVAETAHTVTTLLLAFPVYIYHWRMARREERDPES